MINMKRPIDGHKADDFSADRLLWGRAQGLESQSWLIRLQIVSSRSTGACKCPLILMTLSLKQASDTQFREIKTISFWLVLCITQCQRNNMQSSSEPSAACKRNCSPTFQSFLFSNAYYQLNNNVLMEPISIPHLIFYLCICLNVYVYIFIDYYYYLLTFSLSGLLLISTHWLDHLSHNTYQWRMLTHTRKVKPLNATSQHACIHSESVLSTLFYMPRIG